jgi:hypothetical protein
VDLVYEMNARYGRFDPNVAIAEIGKLLKLYRLTEVTGDAYAKGFVISAFEKLNIKYNHTTRDRSQIYLDFVPLVSSATVQLLDHPLAITQFVGLLRKTSPGGKERIEHEQGAHDDVANAIAGAAVLAAGFQEQQIYMGPGFGFIDHVGIESNPLPVAPTQPVAPVAVDTYRAERERISNFIQTTELERTSCIVRRRPDQQEKAEAKLAAARAELAALPPPPPPSATTETSPATSAYYASGQAAADLWGGSGGPPGGWTRRERF